jgi:diguanylate cyclase (GGDEF)-like protein/PAS domain S-box-containing protein
MAYAGPLRSQPPHRRPDGVRRVFASAVEAPRLARDFLDEALGGCPVDLLGRARQLVNELVTNSVVHAGGGEIVVELWIGEAGDIDVVVSDGGPGFSVAPRVAGHDDNSGWGLMFVDLLSESWRTGGPGSPWVWARLVPRGGVSPQGLEAGDPEPAAADRIHDLLDVRMLLDSIKDYAVFALDTAGRIALWNAGAERLTGYRAGEIQGESLETLHEGEFGPSYDGDLATALSYGRHEQERWVLRKDGSRFWADTIITPIFDTRGGLRGFAAVMRDVTWRKRLDQDRVGLLARVKELARTDSLTGLPNRRSWQDELDRELARARRQKTTLCVAMVDLDGFKAFNDGHGHPAGDALLCDVSEAWARAVRATDLLGRYGGDEFAVLLPDCPPDEAFVVIERLREATPRDATCSAGIARSDGCEAAEAVIGRADGALYEAKRRGRNTTVAR